MDVSRFGTDVHIRNNDDGDTPPSLLYGQIQIKRMTLLLASQLFCFDLNQ